MAVHVHLMHCMLATLQAFTSAPGPGPRAGTPPGARPPPGVSDLRPARLLGEAADKPATCPASGAGRQRLWSSAPAAASESTPVRFRVHAGSVSESVSGHMPDPFPSPFPSPCRVHFRVHAGSASESVSGPMPDPFPSPFPSPCRVRFRVRVRAHAGSVPESVSESIPGPFPSPFPGPYRVRFRVHAESVSEAGTSRRRPPGPRAAARARPPRHSSEPQRRPRSRRGPGPTNPGP